MESRKTRKAFEKLKVATPPTTIKRIIP